MPRGLRGLDKDKIEKLERKRLIVLGIIEGNPEYAKYEVNVGLRKPQLDGLEIHLNAGTKLPRRLRFKPKEIGTQIFYCGNRQEFVWEFSFLCWRY